MRNNPNFKTFLLVKLDELIIVVLNTDNKILYKKKIFIETLFNFEILNNFLKKNIFEIEKVLKEFVNNIYLIVDHNELYSR